MEMHHPQHRGELDSTQGGGGGGGTSIQVTAIDAIVNVNSLFTLAVFVGLAWSPYDPSNSLVTEAACAPTPAIAENIVSFHVFSFSSFLFSSLLALGLKQAIRLSIPPPRLPNHLPHYFSSAAVNRTVLRLALLVSAVGSVSGSAFLVLALINVVQYKVGTLACGSSHAYAAIVPLLILVPSALLIYVLIVLHAFFA